MYILVVLFYTIVLGFFLILLYKQNSFGEGFCNGTGYRKLNMSSGESPWKCNSCTTYGSVFDYKKQLGDQTYGVHNGCQKIF